jgi:hypothetical protein
MMLLTELNRQIAQADQRLEQVAEHDPVVECLRTAPGVGVVTAVTFVATLDEAGRFETTKQGAAIWGWCRARRVRASGSTGGASPRRGTGGYGLCWWKPDGACCALNRLGRWSSRHGPSGSPRAGGSAWRQSLWRASRPAFSSPCGVAVRLSVAGVVPESRTQSRPREYEARDGDECVVSPGGEHGCSVGRSRGP